MFYYNNKRVNQPLVKMKSSYDKIEKELNEPARDYNTIKELVEKQENSITNINKNIINKDIPILPKQKNKNRKNKQYFLN